MKRKMLRLAFLSLLALMSFAKPAPAQSSLECSILAGSVYAVCLASGDPAQSCGQVATYVYLSCMGLD